MSYPVRCARCGTDFEAKRPHARYCSDRCRVKAWEEEGFDAEQEPGQRVVRAVPTDNERLLTALRARGPVGIHSHEVRKLGISGNPSQRITELKDAGHEIKSVREHKGRRPGSRYILKSLVGSGSAGSLASGASASGETPVAPDRVISSDPPAGSEGASAHRPSEPVPLFDSDSGSYRDPDQRAA